MSSLAVKVTLEDVATIVQGKGGSVQETISQGHFCCPMKLSSKEDYGTRRQLHHFQAQPKFQVSWAAVAVLWQFLTTQPHHPPPNPTTPRGLNNDIFA